MLVVVLVLLSIAIGSSATLTSAQQTEILNRHNQERARFCLQPMTWNATVAQVAENYAARCVFEHNANRNAQCGGSGCGENIASGTGYPVGDLFQLWADEEADWTCPGGYSSGIGHWTQIIWASTLQVGCGLASCPGMGNFLVCDYRQPGNFIGQNSVPSSSCSCKGSPVPAPVPAPIPVPAPKAPTPVPRPAPKAPTPVPRPAPKAPTPVPRPAPVPKPVAPVPVPKSSGPVYKKCVADPDGSKPAGWRQWFGITPYSEDYPSGGFTPASCKSKCSNYGFPVFALEVGDPFALCICYASMPSAADIGADACAGTCTGGVDCYSGTDSTAAFYQ